MEALSYSVLHRALRIHKGKEPSGGRSEMRA